MDRDTSINENAPDIVEALLHARYSCRAYKPDPVPQQTIERIVAMSQRTASWCNSQPWQLVITSGAATEELRTKMHARAMANEDDDSDFPYPREYRGACLARRRESGFQLYDAVGIGHKDMEARTKQALENFNFFGAPHLAVVHTDEALGVYGAVDCGLFVSTFLLAAQSLGVATIAQAAVARQSKFLHSHFGIGDDRRIVCGISFGYADDSHPINQYRTSRATVSDVVDWRR